MGLKDDIWFAALYQWTPWQKWKTVVASVLHFSLRKSIFDDSWADEFSRLIFGVWCWTCCGWSSVIFTFRSRVSQESYRTSSKILSPFKLTKQNKTKHFYMRVGGRRTVVKWTPPKTNWGARFTRHTASGCGARANSCCAAIFMFTMSYNHSLSIIRDVGISICMPGITRPSC